ncbi:hypothetical protein CEXT_734431 [Caerostris extrusa]|uniref:Uncharacterized protein n=1 Tax=Caerostris extrusa TaxID=172846 RepID=A0AAV4NBV6_CAEEX|nr:hypothetical protein CEXT_734431 [Caerostris extrusa]
MTFSKNVQRDPIQAVGCLNYDTSRSPDITFRRPFQNLRFDELGLGRHFRVGTPKYLGDWWVFHIALTHPRDGGTFLNPIDLNFKVFLSNFSRSDQIADSRRFPVFDWWR